VLDALIDWQDGNVARACEPARVVHALHAAKHLSWPIRMSKNSVNEVRSWQVQALCGNGLALVLQQGSAAVTKDALNISEVGAHNASLRRIWGVVQGSRTL
jgi:hypothetical protein